ncbi:hypothetical protein, partial [Cupriavidus sp. AcVe19-6a]|uniref:hypothetical protein n=1 Tax=Cupriavidus sp. AcVe19-6a TaxID=2821358 RepID=UPI001AE5C903
LESPSRENRTPGSEGGDGESRFLPLSSEKEVEESGTLSLVLWEPRRNGKGPTGLELRIPVSSIAAIEIEW